MEPVVHDNEPSTSTSSVGNVLTQSRPTSTNLIAKANSNVEENDVDVQLSKLDGKIERNKDPKLYESPVSLFTQYKIIEIYFYVRCHVDVFQVPAQQQFEVFSLFTAGTIR